MLNLANAIKMTALVGAMGFGFVGTTVTPALADYVATRCDRDGDRCYPVVCDNDGDYCRRFYSDRDRDGRTNRPHWICDEDGDNCRWRTGDYDRDDWRHHDWDGYRHYRHDYDGD